MPWLLLFIAGLLEVAWAAGLKYTHGFTRPLPTLWTLATVGASFYCLALAMRSLPAGAVGVAVLGIVLFNEPRTWQRLACIALIVAGIAGLKATHHG